MKWKLYLWMVVWSMPIHLFGQDSDNIFTPEQFIWWIDNNHPVAKKAELQLEKGDNKVKSAKGNFDPYLYGNFDQKYFDEKEYYKLLSTGLKIPTWYGMEVKAGFDQNEGKYLNPENKLPADGLWNVGVSMSLGKGLFIDKRRAILRQAQLFAQSTKAEQLKIMNDLYYQAMQQYWKWAEAWNQYQIYEEYVQLAEKRFEATKKSFLYGDKAAIDTLEAFIQYQDRLISRNESQLLYQNHTLDLSNYLWDEDNRPLEITEGLRPIDLNKSDLVEAIPYDSIHSLLFQFEETHPEMQLYDFKLGDLNWERKLKKDALKPNINLTYNALQQTMRYEGDMSFSTQNYKWGLEFSFPVFLRKQRGDLQLTNLKIREVQLSRRYKLQELRNKAKKYHNEQLNLQKQLTLYSGMVKNYNNLLEGEKEKSLEGESSLFLINSRETKLIQAKLKLVQLKTKHYKARTALFWATAKWYSTDKSAITL
ncbi:TolC family protein [Xanthovirga aplysinae]|uniref:TolC family protein n=1 Tax=Xanthovirga aplysinae TaxID=2529853 RepID=UPI0012BBE799|nr:TolC family protein [Xanthovirga aplysinae]MTI32975.1 TolC family protein [Xanthovirga aplysinae]